MWPFAFAGRVFRTWWNLSCFNPVSSQVVETGSRVPSGDSHLPCRCRPGLGVRIWLLSEHVWPPPLRSIFGLFLEPAASVLHTLSDGCHFLALHPLGFGDVCCLLALPQMKYVFLFLVFLVTVDAFREERGNTWLMPASLNQHLLLLLSLCLGFLEISGLLI